MADVKAGGAYVELSLRSEKFVKGLESAERKLAAVSSSIRNVGAVIAAAGAGSVAAFIPTIKAASDAQEQISKFRVVFGNASEDAEAFADQLSSDIGRSRAEIIKFMAEAQGLFVPIGFDRQEAAELSKSLSTLAFDLASFNNVSDEDAFRALTSGISGEIEPLRRLGVFLSEARVQQELLNSSIDPERATQAQKTYARMAIILRDTSDAQGDAVRTAGSFGNQMKRLSGTVADLAVSIGNALLPYLTQAVSAFNKVVASIKTFVEENQRLIAIAFSAAAAFVAIGTAMLAIGGIITAIGYAFGALAAPLVIAKALFVAIASVVGAMLTPFGALAAAVAAFAAIAIKSFGSMSGVLDFFKNKLATLGQDFMEAFAVIKESLAAGDIETAARVLWATLQLEWQKGISALNSQWVEWKIFFQRVWTEAVYSLASVFISGTAGVQEAWANVVGFIQDAWAVAVSSLKTVWLNAQEFIATGVIKLAGLINKELDVQGAVEQLNQDFAAQRDQVTQTRDQGVQARDSERRKRLDEINSQEATALTALEQDRQQQLGELDKTETESLKKAREQLAQARDEWSKTIKDASKARDGDGESGATDQFSNLIESLRGVGEGVSSSKITTEKAVVGGERAGQVFGSANQIEKQQLDALKDISANAKRQTRLLEDNTGRFAP